MEDVLYTVSETAKLLKCNTNYVYTLINTGLLPALKLGSMKVTRSSLLKFLEQYTGKDLTDPNNIVDLERKVS
jgi:excisionase family DNA binding protein